MISWSSVAVFAAAAAAIAAFGGFAATSLAEGERRAARRSAMIAVVTAAPLLTSAFAPLAFRLAALTLLAIAGAALVAVWLWPVGRRVPDGGRPSGRVDERDIMFARARLRPGTAQFETYYAMRPEHRAGDDRTRALPGLLSPDAELADPVVFAAATSCFSICEALRPMADGEIAIERVAATPQQWTERIKELTRYLGAVDVGVCVLRPEHIYTHIGRGTGTWGAPVELDHRWALAFTVEMDHEAVSHAPAAPVVLESARQYVALSRIGVELAGLIRSCGYPARAHTDGNYRVIAPLVARDAGLGEIGRMGLLMTPRLGPRVRVGVVTTDLPLEADRPGDEVSVLDVCTICEKCAVNCPVGAIPHGDRETGDHGLRWKIDGETCFRYWNVVGTDCAVCMRVCPYSHPDNAAHNMVRAAIRRSGGARRALLKADDVFYGRKV